MVQESRKGSKQKIAKFLKYPERQQVYLELDGTFRKKLNYTLHMKYVTKLSNDLEGFYLSSYGTPAGDTRLLCNYDYFFCLAIVARMSHPWLERESESERERRRGREKRIRMGIEILSSIFRYVAATHFEPTFARSAFPCFDEPQFKARFKVSIYRDRFHIALCNMPVINTEEAGFFLGSTVVSTHIYYGNDTI